MEPGKEIALVLTGTLPEISGNFDACKAFYEAELKRYEGMIDAEKLPEAKKDVAKLRAEIKRLDRIRIDEATRLKAPISKMEAQVKELTGLIQKTADGITAQVKKFEDETRALCQSLMEKHLIEHYNLLEVRDEYRTGAPMIAPMVGISAVTSGGKLTKAARESIEGLAQQGRIAQDRVDGRIAKLEAECLKAGLETPLQRAHVERWINESDACYDDNLRKLIAVELDRQEKARAAVIKREQDRIRAEEQAKAQKEAKEKADRERAEREKQEAEDREKARIEREAEAARKKAQEPQAIPQMPYFARLQTEIEGGVPTKAGSNPERATPPITTPPTPPMQPAPVSVQKPPVSDVPATGIVEKVPFLVPVEIRIMAKPDADLDKMTAWVEKIVQKVIDGEKATTGITFQVGRAYQQEGNNA